MIVLQLFWSVLSWNLYTDRKWLSKLTLKWLKYIWYGLLRDNWLRTPCEVWNQSYLKQWCYLMLNTVRITSRASHSWGNEYERCVLKVIASVSGHLLLSLSFYLARSLFWQSPALCWAHRQICMTVHFDTFDFIIYHARPIVSKGCCLCLWIALGRFMFCNEYS